MSLPRPALFAAVAITLLGVFATLMPVNAAEPPLEKRVADLEAYLNNAARATDAGTSKVAGPGPGHNAWMMTSASLVLFMTLPGLALFYGGLVRRKNILSLVAQCLGLAGVVTVLWVVCGYSLCFGNANSMCGGLKYAMLQGVDGTPNTAYGAWVSHNIFAIYQMMFAIITPALIVGAIAERMKFSAVLLFCTLWMFAVYFPAVHALWGDGGWMNGVWNPAATIKAIDFAGGIVVHITSGWSALVLCLILGPRLGHPKEPMQPHSLVLCSIGTGMLWVGWYGFNAGSAVAADTIAANAFVTTTISAAVGSLAWAFAEWVQRGKPSVLGFCSGAIGGLATITPGAGFVSPGAALIIGAAAGLGTYLACTKLKPFFKYDDALDTFGVHAIGGTVGTIFAGIFANSVSNPNLDAANNAAVKANGLAALVGHGLWVEQVKAAAIWIVWSIVATVVIAYVVKAVIGLRPSEEVETIGLDLSEHGEEGYNG